MPDEQPHPPVPPQTEARYQYPARVPFMLRFRRVLRWLGLENEHGLFSWRAMLICIGLYVFLSESNYWTAGLLAVAFLFHFIEGQRSQQRTRLAMEMANEQARVKMSCERDIAIHVASQKSDAEVDELRKQVAAMEQKFKVIVTPERFEKLEQFYKQKLGVGVPK